MFALFLNYSDIVGEALFISESSCNIFPGLLAIYIINKRGRNHEFFLPFISFSSEYNLFLFLKCYKLELS